MPESSKGRGNQGSSRGSNLDSKKSQKDLTSGSDRTKKDVAKKGNENMGGGRSSGGGTSAGRNSGGGRGGER